MLKRLAIAICLCVFCAYAAKAQTNLVPNGSFEVISDCPETFEQIFTANGWFEPSKGTPDLFNECSVLANSNDVPDNWFGFQHAQDVIGYIGIYYYNNFGQYNSREYIAVKLTDQLKPNRLYCFKMHVSLADKKNHNFSISSVGAYLDNDSLYYDSYNPLPYIPQIENPDFNFINDTIGWQLISGNYIAQGGEQYLYIGNFRDSVNTICEVPPAGQRVSYVFIDNIQLCECDSLIGVNESLIRGFIIYPNPAQDFVSIDIPENYQNQQLSIYNLTGQLIAQKQITTNQQIPITDLGNGMYIFIIQNGDKVIGRQRLVVAR